MSINPGNGVLDITSGIIRVSSIDVQDSGGFNTTINTVARNNILLYDDQESTTNFIPQSNNEYQSTAGVTRDTTNKHIELNSASDDGWVYWPLKLPNAWKAEFDMNITATGGLFTFTFFNTDTPNHSNPLTNDGGYKIIFDNTNQNIQFRLRGVLKSTTNCNLRSSNWQHVNINYYYGKISVSIDGKTVASYVFTEDQHESNHKYIGFSAKTGTIHKIRKININNSDKWRFTEDSNASDICYLHGNVGIGTTTAQYTLDVNGNIHCSNDVTVAGDLTVQGTTTTLQLQTLQVENAIMELGNNNTSDTIDLGIVMNRPTANVVIGFRGDEDELAIGYTYSDPSGIHLVPIADGALKTVIYGNLHSNNVTTDGLTVNGGFSMGGHILPTANDTYDIGSAEFKIRDLYVADNSMWIGDEAKISYSGGKMKFRKRKTNSVPITVAAAGGTAAGAKAHAGGVANLTDVKLQHWLKYMQSLDGQSAAKITDIFRDNDDDYEYTSSSGAWSDVGDNIQTSQSISIGKASAPTANLDVDGSAVISGNITTTGKIGISTATPIANVHVIGHQYVNDAPTQSNSFDHTTAPLTLTHSNVTSTASVNDPTPVLHLTREGTSSQSYGARATMELCRWENSGTNSRSRLDFQLAEGTYSNTHVMSLRSDGRVGIGTTNPASALHVTGVITHNHNTVSGVEAGVYNNVIGKIEITSAANNRSCIDFKVIGGDSNFSERIAGGLGHLQFITNRNEAMRISSAGNLGIGTDAPVGKLDVYDGASNESDIQQNAHVYIRNPASAATNYGSCLVFENTDGFPANDRKSLGRISALRENNSENYDSYLQFKPTLNAVEFEAMRITSAGKVGIGITSPAYKLDVNGDINIPTGSNFKINGVADWTRTANQQHVYRSSGNVGLGTTNPVGTLEVESSTAGHLVIEPATQLVLSCSDANAGDAGDLGAGATFKQRWSSGSTDLYATGGIYGVKTNSNGSLGGGLAFCRAGSGSAVLTEAMRIKHDGNVGIGVTNPSYKLEVNGDINIPTGSSFKINGTAIGTGGGGGSNWTADGSDIYRSSKVGIGVTSPTYKLDIQDSVDAIVRIKSTGSSGDADAALYIDSAADGEGDIDFLHDGVLSWRVRTGTDAQGGFQINTQVGSTVLGLTQAGNVGVGITNPSHKLDVNGDINIPTGSSFKINGTAINTGGGSNWTVNGSNIHRSSGNVGIGTTNPGDLLTLYGTSHLTARIESSGVGTAAMLLKNTNGQWTIGTNASTADLELSSSAGTKVWVKQTGNVGIGTNDPKSALHVTGALGTSGVTVPGIELGVDASKGIIEITSATNNAGWIDFKTVGNNDLDEDRIRGGKGILHFLTHSGERFTITNSGNSSRIGVGIDSPAYTLDVQDPTNSIIRIKSTGSSGDADAALYIDSAADGEGDIDFLHDGSLSWRVRTGTDAQGGFQINNQTGSTILGLTQTGMLGIGTPVPTSVLEIVGNGTSAIMKKDAAAATNTYNLILHAPRPGTSTGGAIHYINGSTRTQNNEGGASTYTIRNDSGNVRIGHSSHKTFFEGDVGIGTTNPNRTFQIYDNADNYYSFSADESALDSNIGNFTNFAAASFRKQQIWRLKGRTWYWGNINNVNTNVGLAVENGSDPEPDIMCIFDGSDGTLWAGGIRTPGNVGIGVTSPTCKLDVDGYIKGTCIGFHACATGGGNTGSSGTFPAQTEVHDIGSCYNTTTYTFTAPVDGLYHFWFYAFTNESASTSSRWCFMKNGSLYSQCGAKIEQGGQSYSVDMKLDANDTVSLSSMGYAIYYYKAAHHNGWGGHLIMPL